jgi:branched-chain amino acid transport system ATP-binding protein
MPDPLLKLEGINSFYGPVQVHFDLTLSVERGQIVCLLGGNASGKSTTMKTILGLAKPRSGNVWFDGADSPACPRRRSSAAASVRCPRRGGSSAP